MKIVVTGSLGNISKPLTHDLLEKGHSVTVISSSGERQAEIEAIGATAAIGSLNDLDFLESTFAGNDAVYTMVPPNNYFDHSLDLFAYYKKLGENYYEAIKKAGIKRVVNLSTIGGNLSKGNGILRGAHFIEGILNHLPADVAITHMRPTSFFYNLHGYADVIKKEGRITANYGTAIVPWVAPKDIATAIAEEFNTPNKQRKVRYVVSEELTGSQAASILGAAIGKPDLQWVVIPDEDVVTALKAIGMNPEIADGLVEMYSALESGLLAKDYFKNKPDTFGKTKMTEFAKEFAYVYNQK